MYKCSLSVFVATSISIQVIVLALCKTLSRQSRCSLTCHLSLILCFYGRPTVLRTAIQNIDASSRPISGSGEGMFSPSSAFLRLTILITVILPSLRSALTLYLLTTTFPYPLYLLLIILLVRKSLLHKTTLACLRVPPHLLTRNR